MFRKLIETTGEARVYLDTFREEDIPILLRLLKQTKNGLEELMESDIKFYGIENEISVGKKYEETLLLMKEISNRFPYIMTS